MLLDHIKNETCHHEMRVKLQNYFFRFVQIQNAQKTSFKMICNMLILLHVFPVKTQTEGPQFLCFLLIIGMVIEPYLLTHTCDLTLILWWQVSYTLKSLHRGSWMECITHPLQTLQHLCSLWLWRWSKNMWCDQAKSVGSQKYWFSDTVK